MISVQSLAQGLGGWSSHTPGGNTIDHDEVSRLVGRNGAVIDSLDRWYFYHGFVVGTARNDSLHFVFEERSATIVRFPANEQWRAYLEAHKLVPAAYTRWYSRNWDFNMRDLGAYMVVEVLLALVVSMLIMLFAASYKTKRGNGNFPLGRFYVVMSVFVTLALWVVTFADVLLSKFPGSF
jgi:hypothetical protein